MKIFKDFMGEEWDLDDPRTFQNFPTTIDELEKKMFSEIGMALCYMDYMRAPYFDEHKAEDYPLVDEANLKRLNSGYNQRLRVNALIKTYCDERLKRMRANDIMWFKQQIFIFQDEVENQC